jgi:hypothetical protein
VGFLRLPHSLERNPDLQCIEKVPIQREGEEKRTKLKERKVKGGAEIPSLKSKPVGKGLPTRPLKMVNPGERVRHPPVGKGWPTRRKI